MRDLKTTLGRALALLVQNPIIFVPGIVLAGVGVVIEALGAGVVRSYVVASNGSPDAIAALQAVAALAIFIVSAGVSLVQMIVVTAMAGVAWECGHTSLRAGWETSAHRFLAASLAAVVLFVVAFAAAALSTVTFMVPLVLYTLLFIYTMAEIVVGGEPAIRGLIGSCGLAVRNAGPTLVIVVLILALSLGAYGLGALVARVSPLAGWIVAGLLQQVIICYSTLVVTGEYLKLASDEPARVL